MENLELQQPAKTYTEEEVMELLQKETDRRVTLALKKQEEKFRKQMAEADKLAKMNEEQKKEYELQQRIKELEEKEREFNLMRNKIEAQKVLASRQLPIEFVDYVLADDAETMMQRIETFEKAFKAAVNGAVNARLNTTTPKSSAITQKGITVEDFRKMTIQQQAELYRTNPQLYKELTNRR